MHIKRFLILVCGLTVHFALIVGVANTSAADQLTLIQQLAQLPQSPEAVPMKCHLLLKMGQETTAINLARSILESTNANSKIACAILITMTRTLDPQICENLARDYINHNGTNLNCEIVLAFIDYKAGNNEALHLLAQEFSERKLEDANLAELIYQEVVIPSYKQKQYRAALSAFEDIYAADEQKRADPNYTVERAVVNLDAGNYTSSLQELDEVELLLTNSVAYSAQIQAEVYKVKADVFFKIEDYTNALLQYAMVERLAQNGNHIATLFLPAVTNNVGQITLMQQPPYKTTPLNEDRSKEKRLTLVRFGFVCFLAASIIVPIAILFRIRFSSKSIPLLILAIATYCAKADARNFVHVDLEEIQSPTNILCQVILPVQSSAVVEEVTSSCGCTVAHLTPNDIISNKTPVAVSVHIDDSNNFGPQDRIVIVKTTDGNEYTIAISYKWIPKPFIVPYALVFTPRHETRDAKAYFPDELSVKYIKTLNSASACITIQGVTCSENTIHLIIKNEKLIKRRGTIQILTSSTNGAVVNVPYLVEGED